MKAKIALELLRTDYKRLGWQNRVHLALNLKRLVAIQMDVTDRDVGIHFLVIEEAMDEDLPALKIYHEPKCTHFGDTNRLKHELRAKLAEIMPKAASCNFMLVPDPAFGSRYRLPRL